MAAVAPALALPNEDAFLWLGLKALNGTNEWQHSREKQVEQFRRLYGASAKILSLVWNDLSDNDLLFGAKPLHLLVLYRWMLAYQTELELHVLFGLSENTIRKWNKILLSSVASLRSIKIDPHWNDHRDLLLARTVDGIHYAIDEPRPFSTKYSSHKLGGKAGLMYEFVVATDKPRLLWLNGPFPAATNDITVFENHGLKQAIETIQVNLPAFRVIADDGYYKLSCLEILSYRNELDPREVSWFKDRSLSRHESFNKLTRNYGCLSERFRNEHTSGNESQEFPTHKACVEAVCVTIQYELDEGEKTLLDPYPS